MNDIRVSIITVCLNSGKTIEKTIQSVMSQTYKNIEYIIIDGQSVDGTLEIIEKYRNQIAKCISEKDNGLYDAMNKGIALATGEIIGIINSDDWYAPDAVENIVKMFQQGSTGVVYGGMEIVYSDGRTSRVKNGPLEQMLYRMVVPHPTAFVRKEIYDTVGNFDLKYKIVADYDLFLRMYLQDVKMQQITSVIAYFRDGGLSTSHAAKCAEEVREVAKYYAEQRRDLKTLEQIENYYRTRIRDAKTKELVFRILKNKKEIAKTVLKKGLNGRNKVSIFGAGNVGVQCALFLKEMNVEVDCFLDNDKGKYKDLFMGKAIRNCRTNKLEENFIIVAVMNYQEEIVRQLIELGYQKDEDFCVYYDLVEKVGGFICPDYL